MTFCYRYCQDKDRTQLSKISQPIILLIRLWEADYRGGTFNMRRNISFILPGKLLKANRVFELVVRTRLEYGTMRCCSIILSLSVRTRGDRGVCGGVGDGQMLLITRRRRGRCHGDRRIRRRNSRRGIILPVWAGKPIRTVTRDPNKAPLPNVITIYTRSSMQQYRTHKIVS